MGCSNSINASNPATSPALPLKQSKQSHTQEPQSAVVIHQVQTVSYDCYSDTERIVIDNFDPKIIKKISRQSNPELRSYISDKEMDQEIDRFVSIMIQNYDKDKNGILDLDQFSKFLRDNIDINMTSKEIEGLLLIVDNNKTRTIDKQELCALYKTLIRA